MATDFFDDDLLRPDADAAAAQGAQAQPVAGEMEPAEAHRLARHQDDVTRHVAGTVRDIEELRRKQDALEKEKNQLENLARTQEDYEQGKRSVIDALTTSIVGIEKDEVQATRMAELLGETRARFSDLLAEIRGIDEDNWSEEDFTGELNRALALVRNAQGSYRKGLARIEAAGWHKISAAAAVQEQAPYVPGPKRGFWYWVKVGIAVSLVPVIVAIVLFVAWVILTGI